MTNYLLLHWKCSYLRRLLWKQMQIDWIQLNDVQKMFPVVWEGDNNFCKISLSWMFSITQKQLCRGFIGLQAGRRRMGNINPSIIIQNPSLLRHQQPTPLLLKKTLQLSCSAFLISLKHTWTTGEGGEHLEPAILLRRETQHYQNSDTTVGRGWGGKCQSNNIAALAGSGNTKH